MMKDADRRHFEAALPTATPRDRRVLLMRLLFPHVSMEHIGALHDPPLTRGQVAGILWRHQDGRGGHNR